MVQTVEVRDRDWGFDFSGNRVSGIVLNKAYPLFVAVGNELQNLIRWKYRFQTKVRTVERVIQSEGRSISLALGDSGLCGSYIEIIAFFQGEEYGLVRIWVHSRFRYFNPVQLHHELEERKVHPWKINQQSTALCGIACVFYLLIRRNATAYENIALNLFQYGFADYNRFRIKPPSLLFEMDPVTNLDYPKDMPYIDWITLVSVRAIESDWGYRGKNREVFSAINWPPMLMRLARKLLGFPSVKLKLYSPFKSYLRDYLFKYKKLDILLNQIDARHKAGSEIMLLIDVDMLYDRDKYSLQDFVQYHWIVYEGSLQFQNGEGEMTLEVNKAERVYFDSYSWGQNIRNSRTTRGVSRKSFTKNYYGFIEMR